ncbi:MAG: HypC/HybG/HupF family hydrogenase formation chaperone [Nitrospirota bacterium]
MCIAIPGRVIEITDAMAKVDVAGARKEASLMLMDDVKVGDYVIVHAGFAIQKVDDAEAQETLRLLSEFLREDPGDHEVR